MAEEVKKIITVEVGKSITSVRDFKKHIEDLRGALLGLNEESEEYKTIAEQIATDQAKLNEVMSVGKKNTDSASGSYNELNNQLKALRQQYKALSETERNSTTGQAILQNITKLDTELKDIDESMGQYYRNVGNYKGAFEEAFKAMAQNIGNVNPELGKLMRTASSLIPLIKSASKAATTGLKGVKAAMASTGIGLLVVALGEIIANWEQIYNWIQKVLGKQKDLTDETKRTSSAASTLASELEKANAAYNLFLTGSGFNTEERLDILINSNKRQLKDIDDRIEILNEDLKKLEDIKKKARSMKGTEAWDAYYDLLMSAFGYNSEIEGHLRHEVDELGKEVPRIAFEVPKDLKGVAGAVNKITKTSCSSSNTKPVVKTVVSTAKTSSTSSSKPVSKTVVSSTTTKTSSTSNTKPVVKTVVSTAKTSSPFK